MNVLFIINGLGMGNSTRCHAIIERLTSFDYSVDVITSGNGLKYFDNVDCVNKLWEFKSLNYSKKSNGNISAFTTLLSIPLHLLTLIKNFLLLRKILNENKYGAIVIDSDYSLILSRLRLKTLVFAINNADIIINECKKLTSVPPSIRLQLKIEKLDQLFHNYVPDFVLSPSMKLEADRGNIINFTPFIRKSLEVEKNNRKTLPTIRNCLIMLSGSEFGSNVDFVQNLAINSNIRVSVVGREGASSKNLTFYGKLIDNKKLVVDADILVINAGFSAVSEAFVLGMPAVVIPIKNHAEQYINAKIFEDLGLGYVANESNVNCMINRLIANYTQISENHRNNDFAINGAGDAALFIQKKIKQSNGF